MPPVFRFAPSPNGELHLGHAFSALYDHALCRQAGGRFLLRIEDIDRTRSRPEFEEGIYRDLEWLGIAWETPVRRQSDAMPTYGEAIDRLRAAGLVYPAFMTRGEIAATVAADPTWPRDPDGAPLYPATDRDLTRAATEERIAAGTPYAWRLRTDIAATQAGPLSWQEDGAGPDGESGVVVARPERWGDFVVGRKDVPTSYHLAVVLDDAAQGVTHIVRGRDLFHATAAHVLLRRLLGLPSPVYHHHRLITDNTGRKLSKSDRATSLRSLREAGATPDDIRAMIGIDAALADRA
ncbi:tRNA glutamyl-Q(34) synthetase GluQRS [Bauldia litoralis]|uniref:Glutamyl-Q tRNA(Asp) synthetase n=1 Tax=Bauldia litoralis TaxID=665467 RepID=A0A1G6BQM9_9HYPH|nr:glutamyl-Q tRNA(Asp) synthetase [Bauldia litoralis]